MAVFSAVRAGIATRLVTIAGLNVYAKIPGSVNVPAGIVQPGQGQFLTFDTSAGSDDLAFRILVLVSAADDTTGQAQLDAYLDGTGPATIKDAVEADPTLGGVADYAMVEGASDYGLHEFGGTSYWGTAFTVVCGVR